MLLLYWSLDDDGGDDVLQVGGCRWEVVSVIWSGVPVPELYM